MNSNDILDMIGDAKNAYILDAQKVRTGITTITKKKIPTRKPFVFAAMISVMALLVGCTIAYTNGWFVDFFSKRTDEPLSNEQIEFIEENEQIIMETQAANGWFVELKSAITDGKTGYILFSVTAPEDIDLENNLGRNIFDGDFITPGNESVNNHIKRRRTLCRPSTEPASEELNYIWQIGGEWEADNDGHVNTLNYMIEIQCQKLYPERECLLKDPFGSDITFNVRFIDFTYEYKDPEIQKALDEKYAGQDNYLIGGEEMKGLYKSDILVEGEWEFNINFATDGTDSIELIAETITVEAVVHRKIENGTMFYDTTDALEHVKMTSFCLTSFGAQLMFEEDEDMIGVFVAYQHRTEYKDRHVYVVMKDGSKIELATDGVGTTLTAESPIVLDNVDYVLLGDGTKLTIS